MPDLYEQLIGGAPAQAQIPAIVEQLRRRRSLGELGQLTGDRVLSPFGGGMVKQADQYAGDMQDIRQKDADNAQTKAYQDAQIGQQGRVLAATLDRDKATEAYRNRMAAAAETRAKAALNKSVQPGNFKKFTDSTRNKMLQQADTMLALKNHEDTFNPKYTQILGPGAQSKLPNLAAQVGLGTKGSKEAQEWWSSWGRTYTLPTRNLLFGATLTPNEQAAWAAADINPGMSSEQIKTRLGKLFETVRQSALRRGRGMQQEGYDPKVFAETFGDTVPEFGTPTTRGGNVPPEALAELEAAIEAGDDAAVDEFTEAFGADNLPAYLRPAQ